MLAKHHILFQLQFNLIKIHFKCDVEGGQAAAHDEVLDFCPHPLICLSSCQLCLKVGKVTHRDC